VNDQDRFSPSEADFASIYDASRDFDFNPIPGLVLLACVCGIFTGIGLVLGHAIWGA